MYYVVLLTGSHDSGKSEPGQFTVLRPYLNLKLTDFTINNVPYRYDGAKVNDSIFCANCVIAKEVQRYKGTQPITLM